MDKALLVGINSYPTAPLRGCVNDVVDAAKFISEKCGFSSQNVRLLTDDRATTQAIIDRLNWLVDGAKAGDRLYFHYSGHGAQMATRDHAGELDGLDEVICPVDFDWTDSHVIRDKDFNRIFSSIPNGCDFVWVSDSCHSGDLSKEIPPVGCVYRLMPTPADLQWRIDSAIDSGKLAPLTLEKAAATNNVALISGCQSNQTSADAIFDNKPNGALTYFLLQTLGDADGLSLPVSAVIDRVRNKLSAKNYKQVPGVEGSPEIIKKPFLSKSPSYPKVRGEVDMSDLKSVLVTIQLKNVDPTSKESIGSALQGLLPAITENVLVAAAGDRASGCVVSGSASTGPGGTSGTITVTCNI